jgi:uncharacterized FlgJ-related protein
MTGKYNIRSTKEKRRTCPWKLQKPSPYSSIQLYIKAYISNISMCQKVHRFAEMASRLEAAATLLAGFLALATLASCNTEGNPHTKPLII